jgi:hypothetical protein
MKSILILGIYGYSDGYRALAQELEKYYKIYFFPLFAWRDKCIYSKYTVNDLEKTIENINPSIILFWYNYEMIETFKIENINFNFMNWISNCKYKKILLNWDPSHNYRPTSETVNNFDIIFGVINNNYKNYKYFTQGFNENYSYKSEKISKYECDINFIGTNLYENYGNNKNCTRKQILDIITKDSRIKCHIYGTEFLKELYPNNYKGYLKYNDCCKIFSNSLLSLNISPLNDLKDNTKYYYSERMAQIIGCESLMVCNNNFGDFLPQNCYIKINNPNEIIDIILKIKNDKELYNEYIENIKNIKYKFNYKNIVKEQFLNVIDSI